LVQVLATVLAAVSSTAALARLGVAGTVYGAALAAGITVVGNYLYTRWLVRTHEAARRLAKKAGAALPTIAPFSPRAGPGLDDAVARVGQVDAAGGEPRAETPGDGEGVEGHSEANGLTGGDPGGGAGGGGADDSGDGEGEEADEPDHWLVAWWNKLTARFGFKWVFVGSVVVVFGVILGTVTVVELTTGRSLRELTGGQADYSDVRLPWAQWTSRRAPAPVPSASSTRSSEPTGEDTGESSHWAPGSSAPSQAVSEPAGTSPSADPTSGTVEPPPPATITETAPPGEPTSPATVTVTAPAPSADSTAGTGLGEPTEPVPEPTPPTTTATATPTPEPSATSTGVETTPGNGEGTVESEAESVSRPAGPALSPVPTQSPSARGGR
jgi:hypothetical protein